MSKTIRDNRRADFESLDTIYEDLPSIRELIRDIVSHKYPTLPIFVSMDLHFYEYGDVLFQFMSQLEKEASIMIRNLIPYSHLKYNENINQCFLPEAVQVAMSLE